MRDAWRLWAIALALAVVPGTPPALAAGHVLAREHSRIEFSVKQMGVAVSGQFRRFDATLDLRDDITQSAVRVVVDVASLTTGDEDADAIALDKPWLGVASFPQASFASESVRRTGAGYEASGPLTIRGRSRVVSVPFRLDRGDDGRVTADGTFRIRRTDFGIGGGEWNEDELVADDVPVRFRLVLMPAAE